MGFPGDALGGAGFRSDRHDRPVRTTPPSEPLFSWVPIRSLAPRHRHRILVHLLALDPSDRYLRFGHPATDKQIEKYVASLDFERDEVFGIFNRRLHLIAAAHLAYEAPQQIPGRPAMAEFGVSVSKTARGKGFGARLFERAVVHARNRKIDTLYIHALSENTAMLKIARKAGAIVARDGGEAQAHLKLPRDTLATHLEQLFERQAAEVDYGLKRQARRFSALLDSIKEVKAHISAHRGTGME
ncbi:GNAT family N-acetyltransferase [Schlegelella sp. S2-27]|uniref:GNAT family N-acetyltransferase n=1 Tax=Caldimonas mangrovi TaxID=2944811 RepID=A0ABT0YUW6_9BURK|nr:GNAT family N-acetyltransferase [Caldimonas mangrovi]MCM5682099.1 GNAT family N-acetyltransferase [Caldimonas mangrovi]